LGMISRARGITLSAGKNRSFSAEKRSVGDSYPASSSPVAARGSCLSSFTCL
jgi:hypothetical protein